MKEDPLWVEVSELMKNGADGIDQITSHIAERSRYFGRLLRLVGITDIDLHIEEVTGDDKTLDVVVEIFNHVNRGGTKLSKGDLALARICADWPEGRNTMKTELARWKESGYDFTLDRLLRSVNTVLTGEAKFLHLQGKGAKDVEDGLRRAI